MSLISTSNPHVYKHQAGPIDQLGFFLSSIYQTHSSSHTFKERDPNWFKFFILQGFHVLDFCPYRLEKAVRPVIIDLDRLHNPRIHDS